MQQFDAVSIESESESKGKLRFRFKGFRSSDTASATVSNNTLSLRASSGGDQRGSDISGLDIQAAVKVEKHSDYIDVKVVKQSSFNLKIQ